MKNEILGIRLRKAGKIIYVRSDDEKYITSDKVIVMTDKGKEIGKVVKILKEVDLPKKTEFKQLIRKAAKVDILKEKENKVDAIKSIEIAKTEAKKLKLNMKFLLGEYTLDKSKFTIYFISEDRVDFRELVKVLASKIKTRLELRQIGSRDEVKIFDNVGMCGREVCCRSYLDGFKSVAIKDAKDQGLQINMTKLSGCCGKLMCCLKYETETYLDNNKLMPKHGDEVEVIELKRKATVISTDILNLKVKVKIIDSNNNEKIEVYKLEEIKM